MPFFFFLFTCALHKHERVYAHVDFDEFDFVWNDVISVVFGIFFVFF